MFSWDHSTREQKFIKKLVEALQSSSDQITIYCGIGFSRTAFTFNRTELLISIRANPSLYAEFNKALREDEAQRSSAIFSFGKTARETILPQRTEKREMFEVSDNDFATQAIILLSSLKPTEITNNERPTNIAEGLTPDDLEYEEDQEQRRETDSTVTSHSTLSGQFGLATARQRQNAILQQPFQPSGYSLLQILVNAARIFSPLILPVLPSLVIPRNLFNTRSPESGASNTQILSAPLLITSEQNTIQNESEVIQTSQEGTNFQQIENIEEEYNDGSESDKNIKKIGDSTNSDNQILNVLPMGNNPLIPTREILPDGDYDDDEDENDENTSPNIPVRTQLSSKAAGHQILPDDISVSEESESASQYCDDSDDEDADETENNKPISESNTHNLDAPLLTAVNLTIFEKNNCNPMPKTIKQEENCTIS
ncbi:MAG: hypothetical protein LRY69_02925 [Gammaproteobacteria bacterium]|nr:hypothetical protein [Gammaproteobacteria bacterium]